MKHLKSMNLILKEQNDFSYKAKLGYTFGNKKLYPLNEVKEICGMAYNNNDIEKDFEKWWNENVILKENILPKPYKKVKCLECGELNDDNLDSKIEHLYNKHNCKPSVGDYIAKKMLKQYFS